MRVLACLSLSALGLAAFCLSACAADPGPPLGGPGGFGPGGAGGSLPAGLFVSPFGELFEGQPGRPWPVADWFAGADTDADGRLTQVEFAADGARFFAGLDLRRDGRLTPDEIAVYEQGLAAARARLPGVGGPGGRGPGRRLEGFSGDLNLGEAQSQEGGAQEDDGPSHPPRDRLPTGPLGYGPIAAAGFFNYPEPVKAADTDTNQTVTADEWSQATERWFGLLDTDHDGVLSLVTLPMTPLEQVMERRR